MSAQTMAAAPIGTLVVGGDIAYRERAVGVLGELGSVTFSLALPTDPEDVAWLVRQARADVVVLDATGCEAAVAKVVAALSQHAPRLGVVVVCEHLTQAARDLHALPKWGWKRELRTAVQRAGVEGNPLVHGRTALLAARRDLRNADPGPIARR